MNWSAQLPCGPNPSLMEWLTKPQRLSLALKKSCTHVTLRVSSERFVDAPYWDEVEVFKHDALGIEQYYVREVFLLCDTKPVVFAKTIMPHATYEYFRTSLMNLGEQFIGESLLYNNPNVIRQPFEFSQIKEIHPMKESLAQLIGIHNTQALWARRSLFLMKTLPMLITEVFLPEVEHLAYHPQDTNAPNTDFVG